MTLGKIVILNGVPRCGKSAIATEIQNSFSGIWMNIGVDNYMKMTPAALQPGIGLRPGGERPDMEENVLLMYHALYETIAIHSRMGMNVAVDVGQHENYKIISRVWSSCLEILTGLPVYLIGINCELDEILKRRAATGYPCYNEDGTVKTPVLTWQKTVHEGKQYDLIVDTARNTPQECALKIKEVIF